MSVHQLMRAFSNSEAGPERKGPRPARGEAILGDFGAQLGAWRAVSADILDGLGKGIEAEISGRAGDLLKTYPVERYLGFFDALPACANYGFVPQEAASFCEAIAGCAGADTLEAYHRLAMIRLIAERVPGPGERLTSEAGELLQQYLRRVIGDMASPRRGFYLHRNDQFAKDFAVCRGKLLPCGVELVDCRSGVPRRTLLSGGIRQLVSSLGFFHARAGGFRPFYELHFDRRSIRAFNEDGYADLYLRIADLLALNPHVRGVMSSSWWHDPQLAGISPELAFIDRHPKSAGARLLFVEENHRATMDATRFSQRRAALHAQGLYRPRVTLLVWARQDILAWAHNYRGSARAAETRANGTN